MENNDSNIKPKQTGGLKLMTVFIFVLALHVLVIGGYSIYMLMSGGGADADLAATDKTHKDLKSADNPAVVDSVSPDASQGDKSAPAPTSPAEVATIPANPAAPAPEQSASAVTATPAPVVALSAPASPATTLAPATPSTEMTQTGPIAPELVPPPEPAQAPIAPMPAPSVSMAAGPVHMPAPEVAPPAPVSQQIYTVKITDSYKKIAHAHHVTVAELKEANHIKGDTLHTGQKLIIPSAKTLVATTTHVQALETSSIGSAPSDSAPTLTASLASAPSTETATVTHHHLYTVMKGDTLIKIAHKFKTTPAALMSENSITDPTKLAIGKKLKIPSEETRSARNSEPSSTQPSQVQAKENATSAQLANFVP